MKNDNTKYTIPKTTQFVYFNDSCQVRTATGNYSFDGGKNVFYELQQLCSTTSQSKNTIIELLSTKVGDDTSANKLFSFCTVNSVLTDENKLLDKSLYEQQIYTRYAHHPDSEAIQAAKRCETIFVAQEQALSNVLASRLEQEGFKLASSPEEADLSVFAANEAGYAELLSFNAQANSSNKPYIFLNIKSMTLELGPLVFPNKTACYQCFHRRIYMNALHKNEFVAFSDFLNNQEVSIDSVVEGLAVNILINELKKYRLGNLSSVPSSAVIEIDLSDYSSIKRNIIRVPRCPCCSNIGEKPAQALRDAI